MLVRLLVALVAWGLVPRRMESSWQWVSFAFVGTSPLTTMPLPSLRSGLIPFPTVVLARISAALRKEVVERKELAVSVVPAALRSRPLFIVGPPFLLLRRLPTMWHVMTLIARFGSYLELLGLLTPTPWSTRRMTTLTRPLPTLIFREWQIPRILPMTQPRAVRILRIWRTLRGPTPFLTR